MSPVKQTAALLYNQSLLLIDQLAPEKPDWNAVLNTLRRNPEVVVVVRYENGSNALVVACCKNAPLSVVQLIMQQYPNAVKEKNPQTGDLPLHYACRDNQSLKVIQCLVQQYPDGVKTRNMADSLPLHVACAFHQKIEVIQWLVHKYPNAIKEKDESGWLPLHVACAKKQSLEVIQWLVQQQPNLISDRENSGYTPLDLARLSLSDRSPDLEIVQWLEAVASGQILPRKLFPALVPNLSPGLGEKKHSSPFPSPPTTTAVEQELAKLPAAGRINSRKLPPALAPGLGEKKTKSPFSPPPTAAAAAAVTNNVAITKDHRSVLAVLVGKNEMAAVSPSYIESIWTEEVIRRGFFGTVYKGTDVALKRSFAIKAINTNILWCGHSTDVDTAKKKFLTEMKAFSLFHHPNMESLYAYAFPDTVRSGCYFVCELAEKGSLDIFWKNDLGPERLSLFHRRIQIALDVMTAIQFLHNQVTSSFRCDIQSSNIVLKRDFTAQLIDCGLATSVVEAIESQAQNATGYLSSDDGSEDVQFGRSYDILFFGFVLAELLTGKPQNDTMRDFRKELDPALGYDTLALPKYVQDFGDLAICCVQSNLEDRPAGEAVMAKLWAIWRQSSIVDPMPSTLELKSKDKCKVCRTFPSVSSQSVCVVCKSAEERRAQMSFRGESRRHVAATMAKLESSSLPLLNRFDMRLNNPVPRLFVIVPLCIKSVMSDPKAWLRSRHTTRYCLFFVCVHSMKAIAPPVPIIVTKRWLEKIAPVLAMSLYLLQFGLAVKEGGCVELGFGEAKVTLRLNSTMIAKLLKAVHEILAETGSSDVLARLRGNEELVAKDIWQQNGDAYELVVEASCEERGWRECMEPVRKDGSPQIFWVSKEVANDSSNGYEIVQV